MGVNKIKNPIKMTIEESNFLTNAAMFRLPLKEDKCPSPRAMRMAKRILGSKKKVSNAEQAIVDMINGWVAKCQRINLRTQMNRECAEAADKIRARYKAKYGIEA